MLLGAQTATESNDFGVQCCMPSITSKPRRDIAIQCCMTSTTTHDIGTQCDLHAITDSITEASNTDISTASSDEKEGSLYNPSEDEVMKRYIVLNTYMTLFHNIHVAIMWRHKI